MKHSEMMIFLEVTLKTLQKLLNAVRNQKNQMKVLVSGHLGLKIRETYL